MSMSSTTTPNMPSEAALQSVREELKGRVFRGVDGFIAKYFEDKPWSAAVQHKMLETKSAEVVSKLSEAAAVGLADSDALSQWLVTFQSLFRAADQPSFRLRSQPLSEQGRPLRASIHLDTSDLQAAAACTGTRVFGEYHHHDAAAAPPAPTEDDGDLLRFYDHARQVFKAQPARRFLHGFLVRGATLELWVFDRSGAYSSKRLDLAQRPVLLAQTLAGYAMMSDEECGLDTFVKRLRPESDSHKYVTFGQHDKLYLRPDSIASPEYIIGLGTTCYAASASTSGDPDTVVKLSWRQGGTHTELQVLKLARARNVRGVVRLLGDRELVSTADLRHGLQFPQPFVNRTLSYVATAPLGRPIQKFASIPELLDVMRDLVRALQSLYVDGRIIHRDIAIKNLIIVPPQGAGGGPTGVLIDLDLALDLDNARAVEPLMGSDGFMAIGILTGQRHTYRHDLESLFYVLLWLAIGNDREHDDANEILECLPETSRLRRWCSLDFRSVGRDKAADMGPEGFLGILGEFSVEFAPLRGLAEELHALLFPVRDGEIFTGTETDEVTVKRLYDGIADAFHRSALTLSK